MNYLKGSLKVLGNYAISLLIFSFFIITFFNHKVIYSAVMFLIMAMMLYSDLNQLALKEKRPQYNLNPHPLKGLILGIIGFSPFVILVLVYPFITFSNPVYNNIKRLVLNGLLGPLYFIIKLGGSSYVMYLVSTLVVPVISMIAYMTGYYGINLSAYIKLRRKTPGKKKN